MLFNVEERAKPNGSRRNGSFGRVVSSAFGAFSCVVGDGVWNASDVFLFDSTRFSETAILRNAANLAERGRFLKRYGGEVLFFKTLDGAEVCAYNREERRFVASTALETKGGGLK